MVTKNWEPLLKMVSAQYNVNLRPHLRVGAGVGHGQEEGLVVLQLEVLVTELLAIDGLAAGSLWCISGLHELRKGGRTLPRVKSPP